MRLSKAMSKQQIIEILKKSTDERSVARFNPSFLTPRQEMTSEEHARLRSLIPTPVGLRKRETFSFLVNLSYASSRLEGNTYSEIDTRTLLEDNIPSADNSAEETKMILNHKRAFDRLLKAESLDKSLILDLHRQLADSQGVDSAQHFLEPEYCGVVRTFDELYIGQTTYIPTVDYPGKKPTISDHLDTIVASANTISDPLEQSMYLFTRLPYLQAFRDCNKRTSRLAGNFPLIKSGDYPISFMGFAKSEYNKGMIAFYEFGSTDLFKDGFVEAYLHSALRFHPFDLATTIYLQSQDKAELLRGLREYVVENKGCEAVEKILSHHITDETLEPRR